jgi:hypothetical protein
LSACGAGDSNSFLCPASVFVSREKAEICDYRGVSVGTVKQIIGKLNFLNRTFESLKARPLNIL